MIDSGQAPVDQPSARSINVEDLGRRAKQVITDRSTIVAGFFFIVLVRAFYPGVYSIDSSTMMLQAIGELPLTNWHPTLLIRLWGVIAAVTGTPAGVWLAQSLLAAVCAFMLLRKATRTAAFAAAVALLLFPPLWSALAMVWKDTQLALIWWLVAVAMVRREVTKRSAIWLIVGVVAIAAARYNSIGLVIGPAWIASSAFVGAEGRSERYRTVLRVATTGVTVFAAVAVSLGVSQIGVEYKFHPEETFLAFDIVGVGLEAGEVDLPPDAAASPPCTLAQFQDQYRPQTSDDLVFASDACVDIGLPGADDGVQHLDFGIWFDTIASHPGAYLRHRTRVALATLGVTGDPPGTVSNGNVEIAQSYLGLDQLLRPVGALEILDWFPRHLGILYRPYLWAIVATVAVVRARERRRALSIVLGSTFINMFVVCLTTPAADLRYSLPVMATMIVTVVMSVQGRYPRLDAAPPIGAEPAGDVSVADD